MFIPKRILVAGLCVFLAACSTGNNPNPDSLLRSPYHSSSTTDTGVRYLLGIGVPKNNEKAFSYFSQAADRGDLFAQNEVAYLYAAGKGTPVNYTKALYYYQKAAERGLASAQYNLGLMYQYGLGTPPNQALAMEWFKKAAAHHFEPAKQKLKQ